MQGFFVSFSMSQSLQHKYLSCWSICMLVQNISSLLSIPWTLAQLLFRSWAIKTIRMNKITKLKLLQHIMIEQPISKSIQWVGCFICLAFWSRTNYLILLEKRIPVILLEKFLGFSIAQSDTVIQVSQPYDTTELTDQKEGSIDALVYRSQCDRAEYRFKEMLTHGREFSQGFFDQIFCKPF